MTEKEWRLVRNGTRARRQDSGVSHTGTIHYEALQGSARPRPKRQSASRYQPISGFHIQRIKHALEATKWWEGTRRVLTETLQGRCVSELRCLGLGSFVESGNARHQLACALLLKEYLQVQVRCTLADPAMLEADEKIAREFGFHSAAEINDDFVARGFSVLWFMPHCGRELNETVLTCCSRQGFESMIMFANTLSKYAEQPKGLEGCPTMSRLHGSGRLIERECPDPQLSTRETAFNDLCITTVAMESCSTHYTENE